MLHATAPYKFSNGEDFFVGRAEDLLEQHDLIGIKMPLPDFYLRDGAPSNVTAVDLHLTARSSCVMPARSFK